MRRLGRVVPGVAPHAVQRLGPLEYQGSSSS